MSIETTLQTFFKRKNILLTSSGSAAIFLVLKSLKRDNLRVGIPANTCFQVVTSIIAAGAIPVLQEVSMATMLMDASTIKTDSIDVLIMTHTYGSVSDIKEIVEICKTKNIFVIEDFCPALGAKYNSYQVGHFGDVSVGSFGTGKIIDLDYGGVITTDNDLLFDTIATLESQLPIESNYLDYVHQLGRSFTKTYNKYFLSESKDLCSEFFNEVVISEFVFTRFDRRKLQDFDKVFSGLERLIEVRKNNSLYIQAFLKQKPNLKSPSRSSQSVTWRENILMPTSIRNLILKEALKKSLPISSWFCSLNNFFPNYKSLTPNSDKLSDEILNVWVSDVDQFYYDQIFEIITTHASNI